VNSTADTPTVPSDMPSLTGLRVAAAVGLLVAIAIVGVGFSIKWWLGVAALALVPVIPMVFVLGFEAARRTH
jgi:hypothetical protein